MRRLLREDPPPVALCDVSLSYDRYPQDVAGLLRQLPGAPIKQRVDQLLVTLVDAKMRSDPSHVYQIAWGLYQMALADVIEDPRLKEIAWWAWDALDLAESGHNQESREQVIGQMSAALHEVATDVGVTWSGRTGSADATLPALQRTQSADIA